LKTATFIVTYCLKLVDLKNLLSSHAVYGTMTLRLQGNLLQLVILGTLNNCSIPRGTRLFKSLCSTLMSLGRDIFESHLIENNACLSLKELSEGSFTP
jgi:hypothetical protein